jgi:hypothetical protein
MVEVGDIVLFRIDPEVQRPLLVTYAEDGKIDGELFLDWQRDRVTVWCTAHMFYLPAKDQRQVEVFKVEFGPEVGQWQFKGAQARRRKIG